VIRLVPYPCCAISPSLPQVSKSDHDLIKVNPRKITGSQQEVYMYFSVPSGKVTSKKKLKDQSNDKGESKKDYRKPKN